MSLRRHRFFVCAVAMMLAGFGLARADEPAPLGKNLAGESCRWSNAAPGAGGGRTIQCGADTAPAGMLWVVPLAQRLPDEPAAREAAIVAAAKSAPGELGRTAASECEDGRKLTPDGDTLLFFCVLDSVGWPRLVLVTAADSGVVEAEGLPAMLPVLQAALAASSGRALSAEETEAAIRLVEAKFPAEIGRAGGADMATYKALVELGGLDGAARNYAGAEAAYRRALEIETRLFGATGHRGRRKPARVGAPGQQPGTVRRGGGPVPARRADHRRLDQHRGARAARLVPRARRREPAPFRRRLEVRPRRDPNAPGRARGREPGRCQRHILARLEPRRAGAQPAHRGGNGAALGRSLDRAGGGDRGHAHRQRRAQPAAVVAARRRSP